METKAPPQTTVAGTGCMTAPPGLAHAARVASRHTILEGASLCWRIQQPIGFYLSGPYPVASTVPTSKRVGDALVSEWYEMECLQSRSGSWDCRRPRPQRALQLEHPVELTESVSDDSLPQLLRVLGELKQRVPSAGKLTLRHCGVRGAVLEVELGSALNKIRSFSQDPKGHTFSFGLDQGELDTLWITVPDDEPVALEHLCGWEVHDD
jgi:hypothetical protein